jgi:hypothetical protein
MTKRARIGTRAAEAAAEVGDLNEKGELPLFFPALAVEGMATSDGRIIKAGALGHRTLPWSILAQYTNPGQQGGHAGAEVIGHMTEMWRVPGPEVTSRETGQPFPEGTFVWQGKGVADPETRGGKLARQGHLRGNSVDLSELDFTEEFDDQDKQKVTITAGKIAATTLCPIPAFADAYVAIGDGDDEENLSLLDDAAFERRFDAAPEDEPERLGEYLSELLRRKGMEAVTASAQAAGMPSLLQLPVFRAADLGDECGLCSIEDEDSEDWTELANGEFSPSAAKRKRAFAKGLAMKGDKADGSDAKYPIENQADLDKAVNMRGQGDANTPAVVAHIKKAARKLGLKVPQTLTSAGPVLPPLALFSDPGLPAPTPIQIGAPREDGRREITGHIGTWNTCHVSYSDRCVRPPHSRTDYSRFATGAVHVDDNGTQRVAAVGRISMSREVGYGGHAAADLSEAATVAHYDNTCMAVADVAAGEDAHGIWIHGLTRAELTEADVQALLASPPSGDWRGYQGNLELCGILAVNVAGFPVPRSRVAAGEPVSLVAAGLVKAGAEFAAGPLSIAAIQSVVQTEVMKALQAFFDPDNDGDIDRPMDEDGGAAPATQHTPAKDKGTSDGDVQTAVSKTKTAKSMAERRDDALRELRAADALAVIQQ